MRGFIDACVEIDRQLQLSRNPTARAAKVKDDGNLTDLDRQLFSNEYHNQLVLLMLYSMWNQTLGIRVLNIFLIQYRFKFVSDSLRGLLLALGMSQRNGRSPQPIRGHLFFHNLQNLWACCNPDCNDSGVDQNNRRNNSNPPTIGAIHATHRLSCSCGSRVLDLIVCEVCGEVFLGGYRTTRRIGNSDVEMLTPDQPDLEGIPDQVTLTQNHGNYGLFWSLPHDNPAWDTQPQSQSWTLNGVRRRWVRAKLNSTTGVLVKNSTPPRSGEISGWLYEVRDNHPEERALPSKCPRCDADYGRREKFPTPLRFHRTGFQKACQVLASGLLREMPAPPSPTSRSSRKLVIFSDSRQDAAKLAAGMERDHYRDMARSILIQSFNDYWQDLVAFLRVTCAAIPNSLNQLQTLNHNLYAAVTQAPGQDDQIRRNQFANAQPTLAAEALSWVMGSTPINPQAHQEWLNLLNRYPERVALRELIQKVRDELLKYGICPGGANRRTLNYSVGQGRGRQQYPWFDCYDWAGNTVTPKFPAINEQTHHINLIEAKLTEELMYALFPHIARTFEGLGQGWISYQPQGNPQARLIEAVNAVIRELGIRKLHNFSSNTFYAGSNNNLRGFASRYIERTNLMSEDVRQQLLQSQVGLSSSMRENQKDFLAI